MASSFFGQASLAQTRNPRCGFQHLRSPPCVQKRRKMIGVGCVREHMARSGQQNARPFLGVRVCAGLPSAGGGSSARPAPVRPAPGHGLLFRCLTLYRLPSPGGRRRGQQNARPFFRCRVLSGLASMLIYLWSGGHSIARVARCSVLL